MPRGRIKSSNQLSTRSFARCGNVGGKTPGICGGSARVNGTRVPVWGIEVNRLSGSSAASIVRSYGLCVAEIEAAFSYADANRAEIDFEIKANEDD